MTIVKRAPDYTYCKVEGSQGRWGEFASTTLDDVWGRLEKFQQDRQGVNSDELDEFAERIVTKGTSDTARRVVQLADPVLLPWTAYEPGDTLTLNLSPKDVKASKRVASIVVSKGPQDAVPRYDVHFGAPTYSNDTSLVQGLKTLIREFKRPVYNPPVGATLPEIPPPQAAGYGEVTVVISAWNASDLSILKADKKCTGVDDHVIFNEALLMLTSKVNAAAGKTSGRIKLSEGDFYLGSTVILHHGVRIEGSGAGSTYLHSAHSSALSSATNATMFYVDHEALTGADDPISFSHLDMDGHKAIQTSGTPHGLYVEGSGGGVITLTDVDVHHFRGSGAYFDRCADIVYIDRSSFHDNTADGLFLYFEGYYQVTNCSLYSNTGRGIKCDAAGLKLIGNIIRSNGGHGFSAGGNFESNPKIIVGNEITSNTGYGIELDGINAMVSDNYIGANTSDGIIAYGNQTLVIKGNTITGNTLMGVTLTGGAGNLGGLFEGNVVRLNGRHGIYIASDDWTVQGNHVTNNSRTTTNTYDGIHVAAGTASSVLSNMVRQTTGAPVMRYGINITAGATGLWRAGNDCRGGGFGTAAYVDAGTASILVWAGGAGDNQ